MNYKECPICQACCFEDKSESGIAGACASCRDEIIPKHIVPEQHKIYVKLLLKKL